MRSLIVLLPSGPATASSELPYVLTGDGRTESAHASAPAALLPEPGGAGAEVVAVVPAGAVSWHQVELPRGVTANSPRLRAVLEGLLEDRLLDEPEALHFALQPRPVAGTPAWVAVCNRAWLRSAVQLLEQHRRPANRIVPELAPQDMPVLVALGPPGDASLASAGPGGVLILPLVAASMSLLSVPDDVPVRAEPGVAELAEQLLQREVALQPAPQRWLQAAASGWDLAQSEFASSGRARTFKKIGTRWAGLLRAPQWRPARWAAVLLVAANLLGLNAWAWKERSALAAQRDAIRATLTETFPQVKVVVDAPVQMERELALLRQSAGAASSGDLEAMLAALGTVAPGRTVSGIEFNGNELRVRGLASGPEAARALAADLKSRGYAATLQGDALRIVPDTAP